MSLISFEKLLSLQGKKLLLAFSGGADSTSVFFSLVQNKIDFDIAIVHYGLRKQADKELAYAQKLAQKYNLKCHILKAKKIEKNFEYEARKIRYSFFEELIKEHKYTHLLTGHHLQDRLEWMLMQLCKGAGSAELLGMKEFEYRSGYTIFRPLIEKSKEEIRNFLKSQNILWFYDQSNDDQKYKRNYFRHEIVNHLIKDNVEGIKQSFRYMEEDVKQLIKETKIYEADEMSLFYSTGDKRSDIFHIDKILKSKNYMLTAAQREELKTKNELIAGRKFLIVLDKGLYYIAPFVKEIMDKDFKEECRRLEVPNKLRPYLFRSPTAFILFTRFLVCNVNTHGKR